MVARNPFASDRPWLDPRDDPNPALRPPGIQRRPVPGSAGQLSAQTGNAGTGAIDVREVNRYPLPSVPGSLAVPAVSTLIVSQPSGFRLYFSIRNAIASVGTVYVSFGIAADAASGMFELLPGTQVYLDTVVPQDDIFVIAVGGAAVASYYYADSG